MNFIEEFKKFENWLLVHPNVSPSARLVWHSLLYYNNLCGWKEEFDLSMSALKLSTGLSAPTIRKAREQLRLMGRIAYRKGSMDHSAVYRLSPLASFGAVSAAKERATDVTMVKKSPMESTMESPMESTEEKSDATFLAKPKQDNTRQSISKESVKKGSEAIREQPMEQTTDEGATVEQPTEQSTEQPTEQPTNEDAAVDQLTKREATVEQPIDKNDKQTTGKNGKQPPDKGSKQSVDEDKPFVPPTIEMVRAYCREKGYHVDPEIFMAYYDSKGWVVGKGPMKSWTRAVAYWEHLDKKRAAEAKERQRRYRQNSYGATADSYRTKGQGQTSSPAPVRKYHYE